MRPEELGEFDEWREEAERVALRLWQKMGKLPVNGMDLEDFKQAAIIGLWKALQTFNAKRQPSLRAHVQCTVRRRIQDAIRDCDEVGRELRKKGVYGPRSLEDIVSAGGCDDSGLKVLRELAASTDFDAQVDAYEAMDRLLAGLSLKHRTVMYMLVVAELPQWKVARIVGLAQARVHQLYHEAMKWLRDKCGVPSAECGVEKQKQKEGEGSLFEPAGTVSEE
jgi:RNA polymerase sigma factor (sigma-70 family)